MTALNFDDENHVDDVIISARTGIDTEAGPVSATMFGAISINIRGLAGGVDYGDHFAEVYDDLSLNLIRFPDGEFPDGFVTLDNDTWSFEHNYLNSGNSLQTQQYQDFEAGNLVHAFSLTNPELIHEGLLEQGGISSFSESLEHAVTTGSSFALVLPEFQYLKAPFDRDEDGDGVKSDFNANDHVRLNALVSDVTGFLENLFLDGGYNNGNLPEDFIIELGNEDFFGWNEYHFTADSSKDLDSYSAYSYGVLTAISAFRDAHPEIDFKVSMQASGEYFVDEIARNFDDQTATGLFGEIDIISIMHTGLNATLEGVNAIESEWVHTNGIAAMQTLIENAGGNSSDTEIYMSAWGANSSDVIVRPSGTNDEVNYGLPAAGSALSLFSGMFEMGVDYAANWGVGAWGGYGTILSGVAADGSPIYAPYGEAYRLMAESLVGTHQINTVTMDSGRGTDYNTYAYEDDAKAVIFLAANDYDGDAVVLACRGFGQSVICGWSGYPPTRTEIQSLRVRWSRILALASLLISVSNMRWSV